MLLRFILFVAAFDVAAHVQRQQATAIYLVLSKQLCCTNLCFSITQVHAGKKACDSATRSLFFTFGEHGVFSLVFFFLQPLLQRIMGQDQYNTVALDTEIDITSSRLEADEWKPFIPAMTPQMHIQYRQPCDASLYLVITV